MKVTLRTAAWLAGNLGAALAVVLIFLGYRFAWTGTGFTGRTIWDWLQLAIIPVALGIVALLCQQANRRSQSKLAQLRSEQDQQQAAAARRETLYQQYADFMADLIQQQELLPTSLPDPTLCQTVRERTIAVLRQLDGRRAGFIFSALREAGLLEATEPIVDLKQAVFSQVQWQDADLRHLSLQEVQFDAADLRGSVLRGIQLHAATFRQADLRETVFARALLSDVDFQGADLRNADLSRAVLVNVNLDGALLDGTKFLGTRFQLTRFSPAPVVSEKTAPSLPLSSRLRAHTQP